MYGSTATEEAAAIQEWKIQEKLQSQIFCDSNSLDHDEGDGKTGIFKFLSVNEQHEKFGNINTVNATF